MKNSIIQSLVSKNTSTTFQNDLFCSIDKVYDFSPVSYDDHVFDDIENTKGEGTNDADTKDEDNCLDKKNIIIRKKKTEKRKTLNTKDHNEDFFSTYK